MRRLRILHISDLHERAVFDGMPESRSKTIAWDARHRGRILGDEFSKALKAIAQGGIDLVCFTGDLADWGMSGEYEKATRRLDKILRLVSVPRTRFYAIPGNHDVQRNVNVDAWLEMRTWLATTNDLSGLGRWVMGPKGPPFGTKPEWLPDVLRRTESFWSWLKEFRGDDLRSTSTEPLGYRAAIAGGTFEGIEQQIHIVGLDSAWLCGAEVQHGDIVLKDQGGIVITNEQVDAHVRDGEHALDGYRIALTHHPLDHLADHGEIRRLLGDNGVDILLHGHQHAPSSIQTWEPGSTLRVLAAGCLVEGDLGKDWPNGFQVLEIDPKRRAGSISFRKWSSAGRFWAKGSDIYRDAPDGTLDFDDGDASSYSAITSRTDNLERPVRDSACPSTVLRARGPQPIPSNSVEARPAAEISEEIVHLAFATHGYVETGDSGVPVCGTLCLTSDDPERLRKALIEIRTAMAADPLVPATTKAQLANASLRDIFHAPIARVAALHRISTTSFSAYLYYCHKRDFDGMPTTKRTQSLLVLPLFHRLCKRNQQIQRVNSQIPGVITLLASARQRVIETYHREPALPAVGPTRFAILEELASFVVFAACNYLSNPQDASAAEIFENLRTRIRYAEDVATGEKHLRDVNPLP
jgi:predicted phosphodiesterase